MSQWRLSYFIIKIYIPSVSSIGSSLFRRSTLSFNQQIYIFQLCVQIVLQADRDNYNALVFLGVASEGLEQSDQALKAYRKAIDRQPDQILAWQVRVLMDLF